MSPPAEQPNASSRIPFRIRLLTICIGQGQKAAFREEQAQPSRIFAYKITTSSPAKPEPTESPRPSIVNLIGPYRIVIDILENRKELAKPYNYSREEAPSPDVPRRIAMDPVVGHGEDTHDPLHNRGKALSLSRKDDEVDMVSHDAEVLYPEAILLLGPLNDREEKLLARFRIEDHLLSIGPRRYMVSGTLAEFPWLSHELETIDGARPD